MSTITQSRAFGMRIRSWQFALFVAMAVVTAYSIAEAVNLFQVHTVGAEWYGVLVAVIAAGTGIFSLAVLMSPRPRTWATVALLAVWTLVAVAGIAGAYYH